MSKQLTKLLKHQAAQLQPKEQRELIAFLISLQTRRNKAFQTDLARKIADPNPSHWIELDDLQKRYSG